MVRTNLVDDGALDALDTDRLLVNTQHTCTLARVPGTLVRRTPESRWSREGGSVHRAIDP